MKTIIIFLFAFILFADSPKHNFTFTIEINGINLKQAAELEREIIELVEEYKNASVKVEMEEAKQIYKLELGDTLLRYNSPPYYWENIWKYNELDNSTYIKTKPFEKNGSIGISTDGFKTDFYIKETQKKHNFKIVR